MDLEEPLIQLQDLCKSYGSASTVIPVLNGITLTIRQGERLALLGKSGSGKSTLLNLLGGLDVPSSGSICVDKKQLDTLRPEERANYRLRSVGMIFQAFHLIANRTALENVELPMLFAGEAPRLRREKALHILHAVGLGQRLHHLPQELSGGERQRVAIARALVNQPMILLADEPTGNLDSITGSEIIDLLMKHIEAHQTTFLLVTHDQELARRCANRILRMQDGKIVADEVHPQLAQGRIDP